MDGPCCQGSGPGPDPQLHWSLGTQFLLSAPASPLPQDSLASLGLWPLAPVSRPPPPVFPAASERQLPPDCSMVPLELLRAPAALHTAAPAATFARTLCPSSPHLSRQHHPPPSAHTRNLGVAPDRPVHAPHPLGCQAGPWRLLLGPSRPLHTHLDRSPAPPSIASVVPASSLHPARLSPQPLPQQTSYSLRGHTELWG